MPRPRLTLSEELASQFEAYQKQHGISSLAAAITELARIGLEHETGQYVPENPDNRGGWQGNEKSLQNLIHYVDKLTDFGRNDPTEGD